MTEATLFPPTLDPVSGFYYQWSGFIESSTKLPKVIHAKLNELLGVSDASHICEMMLRKGSRQEMWIKPIAIVQLTLNRQLQPIPNSGSICIDINEITIDEIRRNFQETPMGFSSEYPGYFLNNWESIFVTGQGAAVRQYRFADEVHKVAQLNFYGREQDTFKEMFSRIRERLSSGSKRI